MNLFLKLSLWFRKRVHARYHVVNDENTKVNWGNFKSWVEVIPDKGIGNTFHLQNINLSFTALGDTLSETLINVRALKAWLELDEETARHVEINEIIRKLAPRRVNTIEFFGNSTGGFSLGLVRDLKKELTTIAEWMEIVQSSEERFDKDRNFIMTKRNRALASFSKALFYVMWNIRNPN